MLPNDAKIAIWMLPSQYNKNEPWAFIHKINHESRMFNFQRQPLNGQPIVSTTSTGSCIQHHVGYVTDISLYFHGVYDNF